ncbi:hypothetical protein LPW11_05465 [Geomonas sp. RF6]|uniref:hypothetical protein n=1 Tax=Geomonas sp. RF6 TaxID=2897342 RepID=UPI001E591AD7|nr:hypothetical protein [Geomonas sp. RF6]UFS71643.1 hypothetical protein LPW11_05465 [Geomonas sp. RF6]
MRNTADNVKAWGAGVARVQEAFVRLSPEKRGELHSLACHLMARKSAMQALVEQVDAAATCAACRGACCASGRYHFRNADLLVYLVTGEPLFTPLFGNGACPYLAVEGCLMPPAYRPFNCITFNCEAIEDLLPAGDTARFYQGERELREIYRQIEELFPGRSLHGALLDLSGEDAAPAPLVISGGGAATPLSMQCNE